MREIAIYLSHFYSFIRWKSVNNGFLFIIGVILRFLRVFTSLAVDYYSTLVKNAF